MATDLETGTDQGESAAARPGLKIVGLHIKNLKSIGSLDLPEDGLGWEGSIPDFVMVGGTNGSGKSTLLEFLAGAFQHLANNAIRIGSVELVAPEIRAGEARLDFQVSMPPSGDAVVRLLIGSESFLREHAKALGVDCVMVHMAWNTA